MFEMLNLKYVMCTWKESNTMNLSFSSALMWKEKVTLSCKRGEVEEEEGDLCAKDSLIQNEA